MKTLNLGHRIAPARFVIFAIVFLIGLAVAIPPLGWNRGAMVAFDVAAVIFLGLVSVLLRHGGADQMRAAAKENDANRAGLLVISVVTSIVIMVAVITEKIAGATPWTIALVLTSLALAWLFSNIVYALHYAHMFYVRSEKGEDSGGIIFPDCDDPDYWDFFYFSVTLGMTFQTSDVDIGSRRVRRVVTGHCLAAFVFNLGVLAFTINSIGGS
ncbi:MAG: DUF1345 domain-containing protein [Pseudomonadota bacterium]